MKKAGEFFTIRRAHFSKACRLGEEKGWLGNGIAYLVLAKSTNATQRVSTAGVNAIERHGKLSRGRATEILSILAEGGIISPLGGSRGAPTYELLFDEADEEQTWLPNAIVDGTIKIVSPLGSIRETRKLAVLETFLDVYDNIENLFGGLSLELFHRVQHRTKECWPVPLNDSWNVWEFSEKEALGSWEGTERSEHLKTLVDLGLVYSTRLMFGDDGPDDSPLFSMCGMANKASNERILYDTFYTMRRENAWLIPLPSRYETPVLRWVYRPFALAETEPALGWQRDRSQTAKAWLDEFLLRADTAIENHDVAKRYTGYGGRSQSREITLTEKLHAIVNYHEKQRSVERPATAEEKQRSLSALKPAFLSKNPALKTG